MANRMTGGEGKETRRDLQACFQEIKGVIGIYRLAALLLV